MLQQKHIHNVWYVASDYFMAALAWGCFYFIRKWLSGEDIADAGCLQINQKFWLGVIFIPAGWLVLFKPGKKMQIVFCLMPDHRSHFSTKQ